MKNNYKIKGPLKFKICKILYLGLLLAFITQCDKANKSSKTITPEFNSIYTNVLSKNCIQCHEPQGSATAGGAQIDFTSQNSAYQTLTTLTVTGGTTVGNCSNVPLVKAGEPENSYLLATLFTDYFRPNFYISGCTPYSPDIHGATLNSTEKQAIVEWIMNGTPQ